MLQSAEATSVPVHVFPPTMTGRKYRVSIGLPAYPRVIADKSWRICHKFTCIKKKNRLAFLKKHVKAVKDERSFEELRNFRSSFDKWKLKDYPMSEQCTCYCCDKQAVVRHHVIPLSQGGRNRRNNIVPLCNDCHCKVHPHMNKPKTKRIPVCETLKSALSGYGAVASWNSVQPKINGPLASMRERRDVNLVAAGA